MQSLPHTRKPAKRKGLISFPLLLFSFLATASLAGMAANLIPRLLYRERILPGVSVQGVDLSGRSVTEAAALIGKAVTYPQTSLISLRYGDRSWEVTPAELGLVLDPLASARQAFESGRTVKLSITALRPTSKTELSPVYILDETVSQGYLIQLTAEIDQPMVNAGLEISGREVKTHPGQVGRRLDIPASLALIRDTLASGRDGGVDLRVQEDQPTLIDAEPLAAQARAILSQPLEMHLPESIGGGLGPWAIEPEQLATSLTISSDPQDPDHPFRITLLRDALRAYLESIAPLVEQAPANARFIFNDDTLQLDLAQSAQVGRTLDVEGSLERIVTGLEQGEHSMELVVSFQQPQVPDTATGQDLGITELVMAESTYFYGSSADRINNIRTAAANFLGLLIAPGEEFSMAGAMKDVTLDNGYTEALIIFGNQTIKGVGGGVCQVSTTLFRTAFLAGFPITERYAHAYRVGYYEQTASGALDPDLAGLDATVFIPVVDFKFVNDTPYWLLMETYVSESRILWKFYSTRDGRTVDWQTSGPQSVVKAPHPLYRENPDLPEGKIKQIDWEADGADIRIERSVFKDGALYFEDTFATHYAPWQAVFEYGPGTALPPDAQTD